MHTDETLDRTRTFVALLCLSDPFVATNGGAQRTRAVVGALNQQPGFDVTCLHPDGAASERNTGRPPTGRLKALKTTLGVIKKQYLPMPTAVGQRSAELRRRVAQAQPDLVVTSALSQAPYSSATDAPHWIDFMDLWSEFCRREVEHRTGLAARTAAAQAGRLASTENRFCDRAMIITAAGWSEWRTLLDRGYRDAVWLPTPIPDEDFRTIERRRPDPAGVYKKVAGFIGDFRYWPNREGYDMIVQHWLPELRRHGWSVMVAGIESETLPPSDGVRIMGRVESLDEYYAGIDLSLAPITLGGGVKVKVLESFSRGVPVVGTSFAFEGYPPDVAALGATASPTDPDFAGIDALARIDPANALLDPFRESTFRRSVSHLLRSIVNHGSESGETEDVEF